MPNLKQGTASFLAAHLTLPPSFRAGTGDLKAVQEYLDVNPHQLDNRTLFQSNLLHIAARNGQAAIVEELMHRGSNLDALDYVRITLSNAISLI